MLSPLKNIERFQVTATDGAIGTIVDFLVDDEQWGLRYLIVETGYLEERRVLVSPAAFVATDPHAATFRLSLTREQVLASPHVDTDRPVSRQHDIMGAGKDLHLRSVKELRGYHIRGTDDEIGHVVDVIVDEQTWDIRFFVIDTSNWWLGKKVLVAPDAVQRVSWEDRKVFVAMTRQAIKASPVWDPKAEPRPAMAHVSETEGSVERHGLRTSATLRPWPPAPRARRRRTPARSRSRVGSTPRRRDTLVAVTWPTRPHGGRRSLVAQNDETSAQPHTR